MIDYLLCFEGEAEAIAALPELRVTPPSFDDDPQPERWADTVMPVALVTADAVYGEPVDMEPVIISERVTLPGFFLLTTAPGQPGQAAAIARGTGWIAAGDESLAGARLDPAWAGGAAILTLDGPAPEPVPVPVSISDRQFAQQLAVLGAITETEAEAWAARGDLPAAMEAAVAGLPAEDRFAARMLLSAATIYERAHPLVPAIGGLLGYDAAEIDDIWRAAALL
ncbi:hypothetical protein FHT98_0610 [Bosea sp. AK1]|uniref:hypothetical protein n=1 Tax=Bosea sp. AK1 TaxID=2587160 RepID=UPI0011514A3D|nr:hypothetical protein [Bosea sp. AK1]TQI72890.1 hypothetical protein FHT98_0610 [Bosea sp. AK1]